jgi:putative membrane protein
MAMPPPAAFPAQPLLALTAAAVVGVVAWLLARSTKPGAVRLRWTALILAALLLLAVWFTPLGTTGQHYLLSAHLAQVTVVMGAVPPLLLLALPRVPRLAVPRRLGRLLRTLVHPLPAIVAVNAAFFGWHMAAVYDDSMANDWLYAAQQVSLLAVSVAFWWPIITPFSPPARAMSPLVKMGYILLATIPQTFGGVAVALAHHPLYAAYAAAPRVIGLDPLTDQQIAGASIALVSKIALFVAFIVIFMQALGGAEAEADEGGGDGGLRRQAAPPVLPPGTPRWLEDVARGRTVSEPQTRRPQPAPVKVPAGSAPARD